MPFSEYLESFAGNDDFIDDTIFFPVHDGTKSALSMRENLPFLVKSVSAQKNYIERIAASNENLRGSRRK